MAQLVLQGVFQGKGLLHHPRVVDHHQVAPRERHRHDKSAARHVPELPRILHEHYLMGKPGIHAELCFEFPGERRVDAQDSLRNAPELLIEKDRDRTLRKGTFLRGVRPFGGDHDEESEKRGTEGGSSHRTGHATILSGSTHLHPGRARAMLLP
jgi:hypothetical protein